MDLLWSGQGRRPSWNRSFGVLIQLLSGLPDLSHDPCLHICRTPCSEPLSPVHPCRHFIWGRCLGIIRALRLEQQPSSTSSTDPHFFSCHSPPFLLSLHPPYIPSLALCGVSCNQRRIWLSSCCCFCPMDKNTSCAKLIRHAVVTLRCFRSFTRYAGRHFAATQAFSNAPHGPSSSCSCWHHGIYACRIHIPTQTGRFKIE